MSKTIGNVWDSECQAWFEITERDGKLYGFPDSTRDGTPSNEIAFIGRFEPTRFYIGNVVKSTHGRIGLVIQADDDSAVIKEVDGTTCEHDNSELEVIHDDDPDMPFAAQQCANCKSMVPIFPWYEGDVWCLDCYNNQQE